MRFLVFACSVILLVSAHDDADSKAVKFSTESFNLGLASNNHFVMFYAPWCGHCTRLSPTWEQLAEEYNDSDESAKTEVIIAKVDCTTETALCSEHDVTGYPTLKFFRAGHEDGVKYRGARDLESLKAFIAENLGKPTEEAETDNVPKAPAPVNSLVELNADNFDNYIATGNHFVKFYAPWCGYCKKLVPTWEKLAQSLQFTTNVRVSKVDCTVNQPICSRFEVQGYPTLLWIEDGKTVEKYTGDRSHEDLKAFVGRQLDIDMDGILTHEMPTAHNPVAQLSKENFAAVIEKGVTFVKFFVPWCGHCKRMAPTWDELGQKFLGNVDVTIGKVDCTLDINKELCFQQEVDGYPTIFLYKDGEKLSSYSGNRQLEDMYNFVNEHVDHHDEL